MTKSVHGERYQVFCGLLIEARSKAGISQQDLADRLGKPQSYVSKFENAERRLDVAEFLDIMDALELDSAAINRLIKAVRSTKG